MRAVAADPPCLTRLMTDDDCFEVGQVAAIEARIQRSLSSLPQPERDCLTKALLAYAMRRIRGIVE
jgi:hypothetical protein